MDLKTTNFSDTTPYPPVEVDGPNPQYANAILSNIGSCNSEMSAVSLYFYNSLITREIRSDIAECFHRISIVEMHHMDIFGTLALKLGSDPRLWSYNKGRMYYWCPGCNQYPTQLGSILSNSLIGEEEAIRKYHAQYQWIQDGHIRAILDRIIADEEIHVKIFRTLLAELSTPEPLCSEEPSAPVPEMRQHAAAPSCGPGQQMSGQQMHS